MAVVVAAVAVDERSSVSGNGVAGSGVAGKSLNGVGGGGGDGGWSSAAATGGSRRVCDMIAFQNSLCNCYASLSFSRCVCGEGREVQKRRVETFEKAACTISGGAPWKCEQSRYGVTQSRAEATMGDGREDAPKKSVELKNIEKIGKIGNGSIRYTTKDTRAALCERPFFLARLFSFVHFLFTL